MKKTIVMIVLIVLALPFMSMRKMQTRTYYVCASSSTTGKLPVFTDIFEVEISSNQNENDYVQTMRQNLERRLEKYLVSDFDWSYTAAKTTLTYCGTSRTYVQEKLSEFKQEQKRKGKDPLYAYNFSFSY